MRQRQQQTQEARQQQQVDVEQEYRRAVIANQQAELAEQRNPDNPLYQLRRAQAAAELARIELIRRQAANVGAGGASARRGQGVPGTRDGVFGMYYPQTNEFIPDPSGFTRARSAEQEYRERMLEDQRYLSARQAAERIIAADPRRNMMPQDQRELEVDRQTERILRARPSQAGTAPAAPTEPQTRPNVDRFNYTPPR